MSSLGGAGQAEGGDDAAEVLLLFREGVDLGLGGEDVELLLVDGHARDEVLVSPRALRLVLDRVIRHPCGDSRTRALSCGRGVVLG